MFKAEYSETILLHLLHISQVIFFLVFSSGSSELTHYCKVYVSASFIRVRVHIHSNIKACRTEVLEGIIINIFLDVK